ncbi:uncharacterized protein DFL_009903 [Arthrobotrys flagrans]|uniref:Nephrocystin 3-like N-terminal domain-containing protein n=1 Tax=Arthrobotrys flagrans TaxID=97331 RepID=A0A436ZSY0_ARTFL|nr:hypothetical protein DFL_009903 [Arthrobotrys flagrans]
MSEKGSVVAGLAKRKTLSQGFEDARAQFRAKYQSACRESNSKRAEFDKFLQGTSIDDLGQVCKDLGDQAEEKANNASRLWSTLDILKTAGDAFIDCAPESVSMIWFGISSLIQIGNAKLQTQLLICGTCDSIANIIIDCIRWEARTVSRDADDSAPKLEIWDSDIPELIFSILDFLWSAKPHFDQSRLKRLGSTLKDLFTKDLQQKVDALLEKYQEIVRFAQAHFEDSLLNENIQTGKKLEEITENIKKFASIGSELVDAVNRQALLTELNQKQLKIKISEAHKTHIKALNDHLTRIMKQRNGRFVAGWLFREGAYIDWKGQSNETTVIYIKGPRGHGKSVAMMSASRALSAENPLICHFFFKKGEQDIQQSRTGLESLLYQLLDSDQLRNDMTALANTVDILNPGLGDPQQATAGSDAFLANLGSLSDTIRMVSETIKQRVYLFIDALDECQDRREQNLGQHLMSIVKTKTDGLRVIFSARDSIDVLDELSERPGELKIIEITSEKNSRDLVEYLQHDVGAVLDRRINQDRFPNFFDKELTRIVSIIHQKAKGDFTIARLIIASLQQPSKESLETKIQRLPAAIGDIYMASLESLTPDEQELIVVFLKWVVWSLSGMTVIEISDHYRELYKDRSAHALPQNYGDGGGGGKDLEEGLPKDLGYDAEITDLIAKDPYEHPEIKDIIYHLENAGRDFFRIDRITGLVNVDISIREWIQEDSGSQSTIVESRGFHRSRDRRGNTVFKFTLTPSFVRYGDSLNELFVKREAQMSVAVDIMRALNNSSFQDKYMPWDSGLITVDNMFTKLPPVRYEIRHWQDHIRTIQTWWSESSLDDSWWSELLAQISIFIKPENFQRWSIQADDNSEHELESIDNDATYLRRSFQQPIHAACKLGLRLMVDYIMRIQLKGKPHLIRIPPQDPDAHKIALNKRIEALLRVDDWSEYRLRILVENLSPEDLATYLDRATDMIKPDSHPGLRAGLAGWMLSSLDTGVIVAWLALNKSRNKNPAWFYSILESDEDQSPEERLKLRPGINLEGEVRRFTEQHGNKETLLLAKLQELIISDSSKDRCRRETTDTPDRYGRLPLYLAARYPDTVQSLIGYGADANKMGWCMKRIWNYGMRGYGSRSPQLELPLLSILHDLILLEDDSENKVARSMLQSATILVPRTTNIEEIRGYDGATLLHLAARIGDFDFFKLLCLSGRWNIHTKDENGYTPMHSMFQGRQRPNDIKKVNDVLEICKMMMNMRRPDGDDLVNTQNSYSQNPLALAVDGYWIEAVKLLIELGADVHDDDISGNNCFHMLANNDRQNQKVELEIAKILFDAGVDCTKCGGNYYGSTPLWTAILSRKFYLVEFFVEKYVQLGKISQGNLELLKGDRNNTNIFHYAAGVLHASLYDEYTHIFGELVRILLKHGVDVTDIRHLFIQVDDVGNIPLEAAVKYRNLSAIREILTICPDLKSWGPPSRESLLDHASQGFTETLAYLADNPYQVDDIESDETFLRSKEVTNYLLDCTPPVSLAIFETALFDPDSTWWRYLNIQLILSKYGPPFRDGSGWSLVDLLTHLKREKMMDILQLPGRELSCPETIMNPSRIGSVLEPFGELSEDGLEYFLRKPARHQYRKFPINRANVVADHPAHPAGKPFYFEVRVVSKFGSQVEVPEQEGSETEDEDDIVEFDSDDEEDEAKFEIGFKAVSLAFVDTFYLNHEGVAAKGRGPHSSRKHVGGHIALQFKFQDPKTAGPIQYVGCGLNPSRNKMFQTFNGVVQNVIELQEHARYFPNFVCWSAFESFKLNFGAEPFQFQPANNPDWTCDENLSEAVELSLLMPEYDEDFEDP